ncbi:MAG: hypothetical protein ACI8QZ_002343 [Chlamydiales bacterium]|jgi:hypothetical protein
MPMARWPGIAGATEAVGPRVRCHRGQRRGREFEAQVLRRVRVLRAHDRCAGIIGAGLLVIALNFTSAVAGVLQEPACAEGRPQQERPEE